MKLKILLILTIGQLLLNPVAHAGHQDFEASSGPSRPQHLISKEACTIVLGQDVVHQKDAEFSQENNQFQEQLRANQTRMTAISERFDWLSQQINALQEGPSNSIQEGQSVLEEVIDAVFQELSVNDPAFISLSAEEQLALVSQDDTVIEWQTYIDHLEEMINEYLAEQVDLQAEYQQLVYDNELLQEDLLKKQETSAQRDQCLIYPYSVALYPIDPHHLQINQADLAEVIVSIDRYLKEIVPTAYSQLSFEKIYELFNRNLSLEEVQQLLKDTESVVLTDELFDHYQYAKELTLFDVDNLSLQSLNTYYQSQQSRVYQASYQNILNIKESQLQYFYAINQPLFEQIKTFFADYLNQRQMTSNEAIQKIRNFHQKYQLKLVLFNENNQTWSPNLGNQSGYLEEFKQRPLDQLGSKLQDQASTSLEQSPIQTPSTNSLEDKGLLSTTVIPDNSRSENLSYVKEKLAKPIRSQTANQLAKPTSKKSSPPSKTTIDSTKEKKSPSSLPSTGEQRFYWWLAIGLFLIGLFLLGINRFIRYRIQRTREGQWEEDELKVK